MNDAVTSNVNDPMTEVFWERVSYEAHFISDLSKSIHTLNQKWWKFDAQGKPTRNKGEAIALMHSELSEALEGIRRNLTDEHLPEFSSEAVELADCIIRILDYAAGFEIPIGDALYAKLRYNATRRDHTLEERNKDNGKRF